MQLNFMHLSQVRPFIAVVCISIVFLLGDLAPATAQAPVINSFSPSTICQGDVITIKGVNFTKAIAVQAGNQPASNFKIVDDNTITATVSDIATDGPVTVTNDVGTGSYGTLTVKPAPRPDLTHVSPADAPFTNCDGNASYLLNVSNSSSTTGTGNNYTINWGDNTPVFSQTDWPAGAQTSHQYTAQGYFTITITIAPSDGCTKTKTIQFYNGTNPLGSFTTTTSTTGLCAPAPIEFQIGNWFKNSTGTVYEVNFGDGTPIVTLTHPLNATNTVQLLSHTYTKTSCPNTDFTATLNAVNGCYTTQYTLNQIIIRTKPQADFAAPVNPGCVNMPVCFVNESTNGYSGNACLTTTNYLWDFGDGTTYTGAVPPCHQYAAPGTYSVTLSASNNTCGSSTKTKQITVLPVSPPPTVNAGVILYCQGQAAVPLTATGTGLLWYTSATNGIGSSTAPTPSTATTGTRTYYVSQTIPNDCESQRVAITVTVNALPGAPVVSSPVQLCQGQTAAPLIATGSGLLWYTVATGGTGASTAPVPSTGSIGTTTYYVSQTTNGCEGPRAAIVVNVTGVPTIPVVVSPVTYCQYQAASPLSATGSGLLWYTVATGGTGSPLAPIPSTSTAGTTTYYVSQGSGCGESPRASIVVNVNAAPTAAISYPVTMLCNVIASPTNPNPPVAAVQTGDAGGSYSIIPTAGLPINPNTGEINPSGAAPGTYTIKYSVNGAVGCGVFTATTTVTVTAAPTATISYPGLCTSDAVTAVKLTGSTGGTYSSTAGLSLNAATGSINPSLSQPGSYTVTYTIPASAPCPGFVATTSVTVTQAPSAAIHYPTSTLCNVAASPATPNPPVAVIQTGDGGGSYTIVPATGLSINPSTGEIDPSGAMAGVYTIEYRVAGAGACKNFMTTTSVTVTTAPTAVISYPGLCTSDGVTPVSLAGSAGGTYSSTTGLGLDAITGSINPSLSQPGSYTVTYTIPASAPCPGFVTTTSVTITRAPSAAIHYPATTFCNVIASPTTPNPPVAVIQTGDGGGSYSIVPATGLSINSTTGEINPSGAVAGIYTIEYRVPGAGACKVFMTTTTVNVTAAPTAVIQYAGTPYCRANSALQPVSLSGVTGGVFTAAPGLSLDATTGSINPSLSQPGIYSVTYTIAASPPCPGYVTTTTVEVADYPTLSFASPVQSICSGGTALYRPSSNIANVTYQWYVVGALPPDVSGASSGTSSGPAAFSFTFTNSGASPATLTIRVVPTNPSQNPCPGPPYDLILTVNPITPAPAYKIFNFCMGDPSTSLSIQPLPGTTIKWYDANGAVLPAAPVISTSVPVQFTYYATQTNGTGCESPKTQILVIVNPTPKIAGSSFTNPTVCGVPSGAIVLKITDLNDNPVPNLPVTVHYNKFQLPYTALLSTDASGNLTIPLTAGTYSNIYVDATGCVSQKIPDVFILKDPTPPSAPAVGYNNPLCSGYPLTLTALSAASPVPGPLEYVWAGPAFGPLADTINKSVITFPSASMSDVGTYIVYAIQNNCISATSSVSVAIRQSPSKPSIVTKNPLCVGDDLHLQAFSTIPSGDNNLEYAWKGPGTGFPVNSPIAGVDKVRLEDGGVYSITVTSPVTGCSMTTDTLIRIGGYPILKFAEDTLTVPTGFLLSATPIIVNAADPGILPMEKFIWTPAEDVSCNNAVCATPMIKIKENACYNVTGINSYGCSGSTAICVKVFCKSSQVFIPNAFAPRGDIGANRILMVRATGISSVRSFRVFNRWGKVMFERSNFPPNSPDFGWDGTVNGRLADSGVYVYTAEVLCENGVPYTFKGNVTLF